jgi:hypothetical protein
VWLYLLFVVQVTELADSCSSAELGRLLFVALRISGLSRDYLDILHVLISAPGAREVEQELVWDLLKNAVRNTGYKAVQILTEHPAVQSMPAWLLGDLLGEAVEGEKESCARNSLFQADHLTHGPTFCPIIVPTLGSYHIWQDQRHYAVALPTLRYEKGLVVKALCNLCMCVRIRCEYNL